MALLKPRNVHRSVLVTLIALGLIFGPPHLTGTEAESDMSVTKEYLVKAAFLFNFARFVEWPASAFPDAGTPIRIGVLGRDPFGRALDELVRGEVVRDRQFVVRRSRRAEDLRDCHIVFVARSEAERIDAILDSFGDRPIFTVGDVGGFAEKGGVLNFYLSEGKIRFAINPAVASKLKLRLNAQLLSLGKLVGIDGGSDRQ